MERFEYILRFTDPNGKPFDPAEMGMPPGIPREVRNVNVFKARGDSKTEVTVTEYGYANEEVANLSKAGLEQCLDKMAASFTRE
jgi:hypothetical protein